MIFRIILLIASLWGINKVYAEPPKVPVANAGLNYDCTTAKDTLKHRQNRGEFTGFYMPVKFTKDKFYYFYITPQNYTRQILTLAEVTEEFMYCYNKANQKYMDSVYRIDFFRKSDSVLAAYDDQGKGYRNAEYPGGVPALQKYMKKIELPKGAKPEDTSANVKKIRVYYAFDVNTDGKISNIKLAKSNCKVCEQPVLDAILKMPDFIPATEAGKLKKVKYILPFIK